MSSNPQETIVGPQGQPLRRPVPTHTSSTNVGETERWVSAVGGSLLAVYALRHRSWLLSVVGGGLVYRGLTGHCPVFDVLDVSTAGPQDAALTGSFDEQGIKIEKSVTINRAPEDLYQFWRNFENLPQFMKHVDSIEVVDDVHSRWTITTAPGMTVSWDAEITFEQDNHVIMWRSLENADVVNTGTVRFEPRPHGRGTEVRVTLSYAPPAGAVGKTVARMFNVVLAQQIKEDIRRFKQVMETHEVATIAGQPSGRASEPEHAHRPAQRDTARLPGTDKDVVQEASEESFPASDAPGWTGTT